MVCLTFWQFEIFIPISTRWANNVSDQTMWTLQVIFIDNDKSTIAIMLGWARWPCWLQSTGIEKPWIFTIGSCLVGWYTGCCRALALGWHCCPAHYYICAAFTFFFSVHQTKGYTALLYSKQKARSDGRLVIAKRSIICSDKVVVKSLIWYMIGIRCWSCLFEVVSKLDLFQPAFL